MSKAPNGPAPAEGQAETRTESDSLGPVRVPADHLWGAQTQRCLENFPSASSGFAGAGR